MSSVEKYTEQLKSSIYDDFNTVTPVILKAATFASHLSTGSKNGNTEEYRQYSMAESL